GRWRCGAEGGRIASGSDAASIDRVGGADVAVVGECYPLLRALRKEVAALDLKAERLQPWWERIGVWRARDCLAVEPSAEHILPQHLMQRLGAALDGRDAIVSTDVAQHQMWAAQYLRFTSPNRWLTSHGAGTKG